MPGNYTFNKKNQFQLLSRYDYSVDKENSRLPGTVPGIAAQKPLTPAFFDRELFFYQVHGGSENMSLKGSKTEQNLKDAFAGESQANRRYLYFAQRADVEGYNDVAAVFRSTAEGETGHAHGHLEYLEETGDPATGLPIGPTAANLKAAIAGETHEYTDMYPGMARAARDENFDEIADWFETLAKAERSHANRFQKALDEMD
jgi:rubrerythrin